jgi:folate-binding protein YgfZ
MGTKGCWVVSVALGTPSRAFAAWIERDVVHAHGPDAVTFLQGQLSQDVAALATGESAWSLLLEPNGKVTAWLRATRVGETEVVLDVDAGAGAAVVARLERFKLRTQCTLDLREREPALAVRGAAPAAAGGLPTVWPGVEGYDQLGPSGSPPPGVELVDVEAFDAARIDAGVPASGVDLTTETIPAEAGAWLIEASVSFTKGCYTGQELVARIDSRGGNVPRPIRRLRTSGPAPDVVAGAEVTTPDGAVVGHVTSAARDAVAGVTVALAPLSRTVEVPGLVRVAGEEATAEP